MKRIILTLLLIVILTSCSPKGDGNSVFTDQLCGKSCWSNIVVGRTTEEELRNIISEHPNVEENSLTYFNSLDGEMFQKTFSFQYNIESGKANTPVTVTARLNKGIVVLLIFQGNLGLYFEDFIIEFGDPNYVSSLWVGDGGINVHFIYQSMGIEITNYFKSERSSVIPKTEVNNFFFFDPALYNTYLEADFLTAENETFILYPWNGFGEIEDLYWPPR